MKILFWLLILADLGLGAIAYIAGGFKRSFSPQNATHLPEILMGLCIVMGILLMYFFKKPTAGLIVVSLPLLFLLITRLSDS